MNKFFKNVKNIIKSINEEYEKCCEKNKELPSILIIGLSIIFVVTLVLILKSTISTKEEVVTPASVTVNIAQNAGEESFYLGEYDKAIAEYEKLDKDEEWPIYKVKIAEVCSAKGDYERANNFIDEAYETRNSLIENDKDGAYKEKDAELGNYITLISLFDGKDKMALEYGEIFLKENPDDKELQRTMFTVYLLLKDENKAKEILEKYSVDEENSYDLALYARMNMLINNWDEGFEYLKKAWNLNKDEVKVFDIISQEASYDKEKIINKLKELSEKDPEEIAYKAWLVKCYTMSDKTMNEAEQLYKEIKKEDLGEYVFNTVAAKIYQYKEENVKANELIRNVIYEKNLIGYQTTAWYYYDKKEYDKAIEYCKKGILENSEYPDNYGFLMTDIMIKKGEPELAEPYFRTALIKEPFNYNIILKAADYYQYTMNNLEKAYEYLNFASLIKPNNVDIYYNMAMTKINLRKSDEAIELINKCISLDEENEKYHRALGTIYLEEGNKDKALEEIRAAYDINNNDILTLNNAGCYYISVENNIPRGYENIKGAYDKISNNTDEETKKYITKNYEKAKALFDEYNNDSDKKLEIPDLHLFY
ncbi:MAG: hypothetical protein SOY42_02410 [Clostridium sp.]|nr:hypothetical protein [Clostridium sp.]